MVWYGTPYRVVSNEFAPNVCFRPRMSAGLEKIEANSARAKTTPQRDSNQREKKILVDGIYNWPESIGRKILCRALVEEN